MIILGLICLSVIFQVAEPILLIKRLVFKEEEYDTYSSTKRFLHRGLHCCLCSGWWIGFIFTLDPLMASIISIGSELIYKKIKE